MKKIIRIAPVVIFLTSIVIGAVFVRAQLAPEEMQPTPFQNRTTRSFVYQSTNILTDTSELHIPFTYTISETSPSVQSAFIQITGIAYPAVGTTTAGIRVSVDDVSFADARSAFFFTDTAVEGRPFTVLYDVGQYFAGRITAPGEYVFVFDALLMNVEYGSLAVELITTYQYVPIEALMPIRGTLTSTVFDTGTTIGAGYNAITWRGSLGGPAQDQGKVRIQFATSECENGAGNAPACDDGVSWEFRGGVLCANSDWFDLAEDTPLDLHKTGCLTYWNDKRYFRYHVQICSVECETSGMYTPIIDGIIVNWSP